MPYGAEITNANGKFLIQDKVPVYVYVGKATYVSRVRFVDEPSTGDKWTVSGTSTCSDSHSTFGVGGTNQFKFQYTHSYCGGGGTVTYSIVDDVGIGNFYIYSPARPIVFLSKGNVTSIYDTGITDGSGNTKYNISVIAAYSTGNSSEISSLELYCFSPIKNASTSGYGLATFNSSGRLGFDSHQQILDVKDGMTITSFHTTGGGSGVDYSYSGGSQVGTMSKPRFLATDWARFDALEKPTSSITISQRKLGWGWCCCYYWCSYYYCGDSCSISPGMNSKGVVSGFEWNGTTVVLHLSIALKTGYTKNAGTGGTSYSSLKSAPLPLFVPIIDGADYD